MLSVEAIDRGVFYGGDIHGDVERADNAGIAVRQTVHDVERRRVDEQPYHTTMRTHILKKNTANTICIPSASFNSSVLHDGAEFVEVGVRNVDYELRDKGTVLAVARPQYVFDGEAALRWQLSEDFPRLNIVEHEAIRAAE